MIRAFFVLALLGLSACATTLPAPEAPLPQQEEWPDPNSPVATDPSETESGEDPQDIEDEGEVIIAEPIENLPPPPEIKAPPPPPSAPPPEPVIEQLTGYENLKYWEDGDHSAALLAFQRSCKSWQKADPEKMLNPNLPEYGRYKDWAPACAAASTMPAEAVFARAFFEQNFSPVSLSGKDSDEGLLTGYYEPEINVRLKANSVYSEPILARPSDKKTQKLPRKDIDALSSRVIAYGRPIDVFFMQVQGSGRLRFKDGRAIRAAYAGNNGQPYKSIGSVLIRRGEMTKEEASKQSIERWMENNGPRAARELMNQNPRYIFFAEEAILDNEGPRGAARVPLTARGSMAIDPRYHPYGTLVWLETKLPQDGNDYIAQEGGLLLAMQDTGSAIKGPLRGDVFFGPGDKAGEIAGVMKHKARWTLLLPKAIADAAEDIS